MADCRSLIHCGVLLAAGLLLAGCATEPMPVPAPPPPTVPPLPDSRVYVYPSAGQTSEQMDRDKYECHLWAVKQTNFDPSAAQVAPHQRVEVVPVGPPPGAGTLTGAATGAVLGAVASGPGDAGGGAIIGAIAGALFGTALDNARAQQAANVQEQMNANYDAARYDSLEQRAANYRRAISACLQGRSYTVR